jgi:hypothetical protein
MAHVFKLRTAGALLALLLLACSDSSTTNGAAGSAATDASASEQTTIVIGDDGSSSVVQVPGGTTPGTATSTTQCSPEQGCVGGSAAALDANGSPGSFAPALLLPTYASEIVVEVRTQSGADAQQASLDHLTSVLRSVSGKTVTVTHGPAVGGGAKGWSGDELRSTADGGAAQTIDRAVIHLLFLHGSYADDDSVLGVAVRGDVAAVFVDQVANASTPLIGSSGIETAVVTHEVGHLLGLVDLYLHTGRQDAQHPGHSANRDSVMYWAVESNVVADLLQGGPPDEFDSADLADLETIRNGG